MRWLELCGYNISADFRNWETDFIGHFKELLATGWDEKMDEDSENDSGSIITLNSCRFVRYALKLLTHRIYPMGGMRKRWHGIKSHAPAKSHFRLE